ncbi:MAG: metallophosphoesterase [Deltaproteobacteria bacterium]|nr:metallophosphoesterase [Deltaproteobacteria bacterium]
MITRRNFLKGGLLLGAGVLFDGTVLEPTEAGVEEVEVRIPGLGPGFDGFTICQITDVHHSRVIRLNYINKVIETANSLKPDLTVLTGDYIDQKKRYMEPAIKALSGLKAGYGVLSILGNHDYFPGRAYTEGVIASHGIPLLKNSHAIIERKGSSICVAGVADYIEDRPDASGALKGVDPLTPRILLSHHPDYSEELPEGERVDLVLAGHTHGGQVRLPFGIAPIVPSNYGQKYSGGLVRLARGTQVYVSRGIGISMIPVRFNCPPELTLIRLRPENADRRA